ncbi:MAG: AMP-binding protein, partial [Acholeplasmatales bacterium]|nr:AMP-binding protein [Acholeplasmatales bacterium]
LYHIHLYRYKNDYYFYFDFHHIIFDGTSIKMFADEVMKSYDGGKIECESYDANEYAVDEAKELKTNAYDDAKAYYENTILDSDVDSTIVYDKSDGDVVYKNYITKLKIKDSDIKKLTHKLNIKTSSFHLASFSYLLSKINMDDKALFLTVNNGRNEKIKNSVGMFVKTYPFYLEFKENIKDYLICANDEQINSVKNLLYPFSDLVKDLGITANIIFAYQGDYFYKTTFDNKEVYINPIERHDGKENISIELHRDNGEYIIWVEYRADLYEDETIKHLVELLDRVESEFLIKNKLNDIDLITDEELKRLEEFNNVDSSYIDYNNTILDSFRNAVKKYPNNYAVVFKDNKYTYKEVDRLSNKLGNELISYGIKKEDVVSILIKKSEYIVIASLGVIKSGAAYQPLDPTYPEERLNFMVKDSSAKALILDRDLDGIIDFKGKKIYIDEIEGLKNENDTNIKLNPNDLFIMLYTSGSTGLPKGVMLEHGNINTFVSYYNKSFDVNSESHTAAYASYGFDADMMDLYPALTCGATVYVIPEELRLDLVKLGNFYNDNKITHSLITTQVGRQFASEVEVKYLKHFFVGGEKLVPIEPPKNYVFHNAYGPTEGTVFCTEKVVN